MSASLMPLSGTVAVVTGAAGGLGKVMTAALARAGAEVVAVDCNQEGLDSLLADVKERVVPFIADVSAEADLERLVEDCVARFGHIDVAVSNAAVGPASIRRDYHSHPIRFWEFEPEVLEHFLDVNMVGFLRLARLVSPIMMQQGWGRIISVTTSLTTMIRSGTFPYGPSKAGNEALAAVMADDLKGSGVTVNVLVPGGASDTPFVPESPAVDRSKLISPEVMGPPVVWLASRESDGISSRRFIAKDWDVSLPWSLAARKCGAPIAWGAVNK